jgi:hypothetical protein
MIRRYVSLVYLAATLAVGSSALAGEARYLQGLFCNAEAQIDQVLTDIAAGIPLRRAAAIANRDAVVCTYVDSIKYLIANPVALSDAALSLVKYRGALVGVLVGGSLRPVTPEAELYFLTPRIIVDAGIERRT